MVDIKKYQVIVLTECPFCKRAVDLLKQSKKQFSVLVLDHDTEMLEHLKKTTNHMTVPIVLGMMENGQQLLIGGFTELEKHISSLPIEAEEDKVFKAVAEKYKKQQEVK